MKDRIQSILIKEGLTAKRFAELIGIQSSAMSHILSGRNNASLDVVQKILRSFPQIDPDWLLSGNGDMFRKGIQPTEKQSVEKKIMPSQHAENSKFDGTIHFPSDNEEEIETKIETKNETEIKKEGRLVEEKIESKSPISTDAPEAESTENRVTVGHTIKRILVLYTDGSYEELVKG